MMEVENPLTFDTPESNLLRQALILLPMCTKITYLTGSRLETCFRASPYVK